MSVVSVKNGLHVSWLTLSQNYIAWVSLDDLNSFQSSPACAEFLRNLPEQDNSQASIEACSGLRHLTLDDASSPSRFLTLRHITEAATSQVEGRVTLTAFVVPRKVDDIRGVWDDNFRTVFGHFVPRGSQFVTHHDGFWFKSLSVWLWVLTEDHWVEKKFGKLEQTQDGDQGRTIFCYFHLWPPRFGATPEHEAASAVDPQARDSWNQAIAHVMPPATAWEQERWDIQEVPRFYPAEPEWDPELPVEYQQEQQRLKEEYPQFHGFEVGERSQ